MLTAELFLPIAQYREPQQITAFQDALMGSLSSAPASSWRLRRTIPCRFPVTLPEAMSRWLAGWPVANQPIPVVFQSRVTSGYFQAMGIPLLLGRYLMPEDNHDAVRVAVIDQTLAGRFFPGENPLGRHILTRDRLECTIVGVAGATKYRDLAAPPEPVIYLSALQSPGPSISLAIRTAIDPLMVLSAVRAKVAALDPNVPVAHPATMEQRLADSVARQRFSTQLMMAFAAISALLAAIGIYGVLSYVC